LKAGAAGALLLPERILADPYAPFSRAPVGQAAPPPVRIRGRVSAGGRGLSGVAVTDGLAVVTTRPDGTYELVSDLSRDFVYVSVPAGHRVPIHPYGTARFYRRVSPGSNGGMLASWTFEPTHGDDDHHAVLVLADPQTQDEEEMGRFHEQTVPDVRATLAGLDTGDVLGIACGDIMYDNLELYPQYERAVGRMGIPFYQVVGNHDLDQESATDLGSTTTFSSHFGPRYYSFDRGAAHYVILDDVHWQDDAYRGYLDDEQLRWLGNDLTHVEAGRPVIVATHIPAQGTRFRRQGNEQPADGMAITNREALYRLLEPYQTHILTGHTHENEHLFDHGVHEHVHGAVCGAWWTGPICYDGTPNGYSIYEVDGESVSWRYKATGYGAAHQMRLYAPGADPSAGDQVVANVWDWDPEWRVLWYEDGQPKGEMTRRVGLDPLSVELHAGPDLPPRRSWVDPVPVSHLFYATPTPTAGEVRVEATDRFGRVYSEALRLVP
jgi:hypothetical protein